MSEPTTRRRPSPARASSHGADAYEPARDPSLGDLVTLAVNDLRHLVRCEKDLAMLELKRDGRRLVVGGVLLGVAAFFGCLILMMLCFALVYALGPSWASFLWGALACLVLGAVAVAVVVGFAKFRGLDGMPKTRSTVSDLALIRRDDSNSPTESAKAR
jgi:hypothetical protein